MQESKNTMINNSLYLEDLKRASESDLPWHKLSNTKVVISGASGLLGSFLVDLIMYKNMTENLKCKIYAIGRNEEKARKKFEEYWKNDFFLFTKLDINSAIKLNWEGSFDYVLHMASNTHPLEYSSDPIGTIVTNVVGTNNMLKFAVMHNSKRFLFASSNEIYGENRNDVELFDESYCGYLDSNTLRAGYPESKRCGEALCQAYRQKEKLDVVIARFTRSYGPTIQDDDTKAITQFIKNAVKKENIVLKSEGNQYYSYTYVADAIIGALTILLKGEDGQAYNIADKSSDIKLRDLASFLAEYTNTSVIYKCPEATEKMGYSVVTKARLDGRKLMNLGWKAQFDIKTGIKRTVEILRQTDVLR